MSDSEELTITSNRTAGLTRRPQSANPPQPKQYDSDCDSSNDSTSDDSYPRPQSTPKSTNTRRAQDRSTKGSLPDDSSDSEEKAKIQARRRPRPQNRTADPGPGYSSTTTATATTATATTTATTPSKYSQMLSQTPGNGLRNGGQDSDDEDSESSDTSPECSICRNNLRNVVKLKCGHKFCYGCIKGSILHGKKDCPYCRNPINQVLAKQILRSPEKICRDIEDVNRTTTYFWVYEGRGKGWWNFDNKSNTYLERAYENWKSLPLANRNGASPYSMCVSGINMHIDFINMVQRNPNSGAARGIKRLSIEEMKQMEQTGEIIGMAGIRRTKDANQATSSPTTSNTASTNRKPNLGCGYDATA